MPGAESADRKRLRGRGISLGGFAGVTLLADLVLSCGAFQAADAPPDAADDAADAIADGSSPLDGSSDAPSDAPPDVVVTTGCSVSARRLVLNGQAGHYVLPSQVQAFTPGNSTMTFTPTGVGVPTRARIYVTRDAGAQYWEPSATRLGSGPASTTPGATTSSIRGSRSRATAAPATTSPDRSRSSR
jgi:hypothetical protein